MSIYGTPAHTPRTGTVDNVPREALRIVIALAWREAGKEGAAHAGGPAMMSRAITMVQAAYDAEGVKE